MSCSFLTPTKRVDLTARVLAALARRHPRQAIAWTHFGAGPSRADVDAEVRRLPANIEVTLTGHVPHAAVLAHYTNQPVDLFVHLSSREGLPVSIQEALAHGVPVVACDVGGVAEAFDAASGSAALLPVDASVEQVVSAVEDHLLASSEVQALRRARTWQHWQAHFDAQHNHAQLARTLAEL